MFCIFIEIIRFSKMVFEILLREFELRALTIFVKLINKCEKFNNLAVLHGIFEILPFCYWKSLYKKVVFWLFEQKGNL